MSHTKQTPILEYTDAELQSLTVPAGTITHNTTLSCLSYYTGQEWINSDDWESTYDTVSALSASWSEGASTGAILSASSSANNAALIAKTYSTGYTNIDNEHPGNVRGDYAVDLQMDRHPVAATAAPQVAAGTGSVIIGGSRNTISTGANGLYASVLGGAGNTIGVAQYGVTIGGLSNFVGGLPLSGGTVNANHSIACGKNTIAKHHNVFIYGSSDSDPFESKQINTFNINASNGLRLVHDTNDHTGDVLTCLDADGHGKWQALSADEWNSTYTTVSTNSAAWGTGYDDTWLSIASGDWESTYTTVSANSANWDAHADLTDIQAASGDWESTYTTVSANSGIWNGSSAIAWEDGNVGSLEIGTLDTTTQTGQRAITIGYRTISDRVASANQSIAIGYNSKASLDRNIAIGPAAIATGSESIAIGNGTSGTQSTGGSAVAIGYNALASEFAAIAVGFQPSAKGASTTAIGNNALADTNTTNSTAVGYYTKITSNSDFSTAIGPYTQVAADDIQEFGQWQSSDGGVTRIRQAAVRCQGWNLSPTHQGMVCITALSSSSARTNAAGPADGTELRDTIPRGMYTIRRWGDVVYLDTNDNADNILTIPLDSTLGDSAYTTVSANSANWDSTYTTVSSNSATWANTQQTITSSASALTLDVSLGHSATTTLTENITSFTIQNASTGDSGVLIISSNGGGWTFPDQNGLGASHIVHTGSPDNVSTLTSATSSAVSIGWYYDGSRHFLYISDPT